MSRSVTPLTNSSAVAPGSTVVQQVYTSTGFNAGDYVYAYVSGGTQQTGFGRPSVSIPLYGAAIANAAQVTSSTFTGAQAAYGPIQEAAAYSGSNMTGGSNLVAPVQIATAASYATKVAVINNGNIVCLYSNGSNLNLAVYNSSGTLVSGPTTVISNLSTSPASSNYGVAATSSGGYIVVAIQSNSNQYINFFNSSNVSLGAGTIGAGINTSGYVDATSFAFGTGQDYWGYVNPTGSSYFGILNGTSSIVWTNAGVTNTAKQELVQVLGVNNNVNVLMLSNASSTNCAVVSLSSGTIAGTLTLPSYVQATGNCFGFCTSLAGGGRFIYVGSPNGINLTAYVYQWTGTVSAGAFSIVKTISLDTSGDFSTTGICVKPMYNGGFVVTTNNVSGVLKAYVVNYTAGDFTAPVAYTTSIPSGYTGATATLTYCATTPSGGIAIGYNDGLSRPFFVVIAAQTLISGSTILNGSNTYGPANNYYLLGVAATSAAAGSVGEVIVNGPAALGSTYPSVPNQINFDYSSVGPPSRGNKGYVSGTTAVLKGYE